MIISALIIATYTRTTLRQRRAGRARPPSSGRPGRPGQGARAHAERPRQGGERPKAGRAGPVPWPAQGRRSSLHGGSTTPPSAFASIHGGLPTCAVAHPRGSAGSPARRPGGGTSALAIPEGGVATLGWLQTGRWALRAWRGDKNQLSG